EHSGLESRMAIAWGGERAIVDIEAEALDLPEGAEIVLDQRCGDGWYMSSAENVALNLGEHAIDAAYVWARVRDPLQAGGGWSVTRSGATSVGAKPVDEWRWLRADAPLSGDGPLTLALDTAVEIDQIIVTDDADLAPVGVLGTVNTTPGAPGAPVVEETSAIDVTLSWQPAEGAEYYRVYAGGGDEIERGNATLIATPSEPSFVDAGLTPATTYRYLVTAMDAWGNESEPTGLVEARTADADWTTRRFGGEDAELEAPMVYAADDTAESGGYVHVPDEHSDETYVFEGSATFTFEAPTDGVYTFWGRTMGLDGKSDSFFVKLNDRDEQEWHVGHGRDGLEWRWVPLSSLAPTRLAAGEHTLRIHSREDGTRLDTIIVTNDPFFTPE
ncbi:MAG: hypothetical protein ACLFU7_11500, partial [Armatimonadota bacterium]